MVCGRVADGFSGHAVLHSYPSGPIAEMRARPHALAYVLRWEGDVTLTCQWHTRAICQPATGVPVAFFALQAQGRQIGAARFFPRAGISTRRVLEGRGRADAEQIIFMVLASTTTKANGWGRGTIPNLLRREG